MSSVLPVHLTAAIILSIGCYYTSQAFILPELHCHAFTPTLSHLPLISTSTSLSSFVTDSSDYSTDKSIFGGSYDSEASANPARGDAEMAGVPVVEEIPVPTSRNNNGNRFVALVFDQTHSEIYLQNDDDVLWKMHEDRVALTEEHVMWARKQNLYNETFNTESMADVLWSHQLLSSDLQRAIGHAMCIDSPTINSCREAMSRDPIIRSLLGVDAEGNCDVSSVPLYRWRHIRDYTLRCDDGRDGVPTMLLAFDRPEAISDGVREEVFNEHLEYMIRSERVIATGALHVPTENKMDKKSTPIGTLMIFNAIDRENAIDFVENDPAALAGLYGTMTIHRFNNLDVTGKFVSESQIDPKQNTYQMKEAMEHWGYPVDDTQTKWLNW